MLSEDLAEVFRLGAEPFAKKVPKCVAQLQLNNDQAKRLMRSFEVLWLTFDR